MEQANINVVVRCRGRNKPEIEAKSSVVVKIPADDSTKIAVNTSNDRGIAGDMTSRMFEVDQVYGPEAEQSQFFQGTAEPLFKEFLKGYNCTMFAYGQTGTGKTYTMHGDEKISNGSFSPNAGIIPRILYTLFDTLKCLEGSDFLIKCSFLELYNEELKDLFAVDESKRLRIFDSKSNSNSKCTITTQNLLEVLLRDAEHGMKMLQMGIEKRKVASTKMNDVSSRSHTVFTITLFKQELTSDQELKEYRISKFNLVDLAGSENIGRSGALNQRAREAGSINQSLLTLGRVINSLVDGESHVPYRESKLTRLLQDSIGGKTKTVLIANISPARINCEETLSTLQYASKAKNIKNKPQIGNLATKTVLIRELGQELQKLQADLTASRKKNGIYLDRDNYNEFQSEFENLKTVKNECLVKNEVLSKQNQSLQQQLEQHDQAISKKNTDLENLSKIISNLYEKIDRQSANHQNLMENSSRLKTIIDLMNENIYYLINNEKSIKMNIQKLINDSLSQESEKLQLGIDNIVQLSNLDDSQSINSLKGKINAEFNLMKLSMEQFSVKVADLFISSQVYGNLTSQLQQLAENVQEIKSNHVYQDFQTMNESLNHEMFGNVAVSENLTKQVEEEINGVMEEQEEEILNSVKLLLRQNSAKQKSRLQSRVMKLNHGLIVEEKQRMKIRKLNYDQQFGERLKTSESIFNGKISDMGSIVTEVRNDLKAVIEKTNSSQLEVKSELIKVNSQTSIEENHEALINKLNNSITEKYRKIRQETHGLKSVHQNITEQIGSINNDILYENQENATPVSGVYLPNNERVINDLIDELDQEKSVITTQSAPTGKTPKMRDRLKINQTPNRSPSKRVISELKEKSLNNILKDNKDLFKEEVPNLKPSRPLVRKRSRNDYEQEKKSKKNGTSMLPLRKGFR